MALSKRLSTAFFLVAILLFVHLLNSSVTIGNAQRSDDSKLDGAIIFPNNQGVGNPGETVIYQHTVKNVGPFIETFDLTADSSENWSVTVSPEEVTLNGNQETLIIVTIVVRPNAQQGDIDTTTVTVTSQSDPTITDFSTDTTLVPIPMFLPIMANNAGEPTPECQLINQPPDNPPGVDLVVTAISLNPNPPQPGQQATIRVTVKNQGLADVAEGNNFIIDFYDDPLPEPPGPLQPGNLFWGVQGVDFTAGTSLTFVGTYTFDAGFHHLYAQIDTDGVVAEANETNNVYGCLGLTVN